MRPAYRDRRGFGRLRARSGRRAWVAYEGGLGEVGHTGSGFAFDNESPRHKVYLEPFRLAGRTVTNAEYLAFMADGGYDRPEFWLSDGWNAWQALGWSAPLHWRMDRRPLAGLLAGRRARELVAGAPVCHLSYYEADAYARWAGAACRARPSGSARRKRSR